MRNKSEKIRLELGKRFALRKIIAQLLVILIVWQTVVPAAFGIKSSEKDNFLIAKNLLSSKEKEKRREDEKGNLAIENNSSNSSNSNIGNSKASRVNIAKSITKNKLVEPRAFVQSVG